LATPKTPHSAGIAYSVTQKNPPPLRPAVFWHFWQMVENFKSIFHTLICSYLH